MPTELSDSEIKTDKASSPLIKSEVSFNGVSISMVTHIDDKVLGARCRGEREMSKQELGELGFLQSAIKPHSHVLDAGANIGAYAIVLAKTQPTATIYCFEPDPLNFSLLNVNIQENDITNIYTFNYALGKEQKFINLYLNPTNFMDHRCFLSNKNDFGEEAFSMSAARVLMVNPVEFLKATLKDKAPKYIDLLKIDTQGADFDILESCMPLLRSNSIISIEYSPYHLFQNGTTEQNVREVLENFSCIRKVSLKGEVPRLTVIGTNQLLNFYEESYRKYQGYWDLVLTQNDPTVSEVEQLRKDLASLRSQQQKSADELLTLHTKYKKLQENWFDKQKESKELQKGFINLQLRYKNLQEQHSRLVDDPILRIFIRVRSGFALGLKRLLPQRVYNYIRLYYRRETKIGQ